MNEKKKEQKKENNFEGVIDEIKTTHESIQSEIVKLVETIRELTKAIGDLTTENQKWFKAGRMMYIIGIIAFTGGVIC